MKNNSPSRETYIQSINKMMEDIDLATIERIYHFIQRKWRKKDKTRACIVCQRYKPLNKLFL